MTEITAEIVRKIPKKGMKAIPVILWWSTDVRLVCADTYTAIITVRDPWTYGTLESDRWRFSHFPTGGNYAYMIYETLKKAHPDFDFTWNYNYEDNRIIITYDDGEPEEPVKYIRSRYGTTIAPPSWHEKSKENKTMELRLVKLVTNGPATIGWFGRPYERDLMKVVVKRAEGEYDDPEKAILALYMKALSGGHTPFHSRMNRAMKMMYAAIDKEKEIEEAKLAREEKKDPTFGEDVVEQFKATFNATEVKGAGAAWTWDEVSFLNRHYNSKSTKSIAMALGRSECAVRSKAKRLGIKKRGNTHG